MRKTCKLSGYPFRSVFSILISLSAIYSCSQDRPHQNDNAEKESNQKPPHIIQGKAPVVTLLDTCPPPRTISIPQKMADAYSIKTEDGSKTIQILPPEINSAGFYIPMQTFTTRNGLPSNSIVRGYRDKSGNLWFSTYGGGVIRYDGKSFTNFTSAQGLAKNWAWGIYEDRNGNLWFGTDGAGVSRYDGTSFRNYTTADGLADNIVWAINEDKNGDLWFGTGAGLSRLKPDGTFAKYTTEQGLAENNVSSICFDKSGNLWAGTWGSGVSCYDGKSFTNYTDADGLSNNHVGCIFEDKDENLWVGNEDGKISWLDHNKRHPGGKATFMNYSIAKAGGVNTITEDKNGNLWFGTAEGALRLRWDKKSSPDKKDFTQITTRQGLPNNFVNVILEDKGGNIWFGTEGISLLERDLNFLTCLTINDSLLHPQVRVIIEDEKKNLWFGTVGESSGLLQLTADGKSLLKYSTSQGLPDNAIISIFQDKSGSLWIGNFSAGVSRISSDGRSITRYTTAHGLPPSGVVTTIEDKYGDLWFGTWKHGVARLSVKTRSLATYTTEQGLPHNDITDIVEAKNGDLWIGTYGGGLSRYNGKSFTNYTTEQGLPANDISCILQDRNGMIWIGTWPGGVSRFDGKSFLSFTTADGLPDDQIKAMRMDKEGTIWIGTNKGFTTVVGFAQKEQNSFDQSQKNLPPSNDLSNAGLKHNNFTPVFQFYNVKTGYPIEGITSTLLLTGDGTIWAGTESRERTVRFAYGNIHKNPAPPIVSIQRIKINNENISWYDINDKQRTDNFTKAPHITDEIMQFGRQLDDGERREMQKKFSVLKFDSIARFYPVPVNLVLPYKYNNITFDFNAIEPSRPGFVRYQYILDGYENEWSPVSDKTTATYGNIREGRYTLKVRAQNPDGVWSKPINYTFTVLPPWYRTWWFFVILVSCSVTLFYFLIRWTLQQSFQRKLARSEKEREVAEMKQKNAELQQQSAELEMQALRAQMNPHFIFNCLNSINMFILESNKQQASDYLAKFSRLVRLILQNSQEAFIPLDKELEALRLYLELESLRFEQRFEYKVSVIDVDTTMVKVPPLIIQPFAENAIWHGLMHKKEKGHLYIEVYLEDVILFCKITDDGVGRSKAAEIKSKSALTYKSMGTRITADRIAILQQQEQNSTFITIRDLELPDGQVAGTEVLIKIPQQ